MNTTTTETAAMREPAPDHAVATLLLAFAADPLVRWILPHSAAYLAHFPHVIRALGAPAFQAGTVDATEGDTSVALWVPPGSPPTDESAGEIIAQAVDPGRLSAVTGFLQAMSAHRPATPHWYVPFGGVEPAHQGRSLGATALRHGLTRADRDRLPVYLDATNTRSRTLCERHGFAVTAEVQVGDSPPVWPMLREPAGTPS